MEIRNKRLNMLRMERNLLFTQKEQILVAMGETDDNVKLGLLTERIDLINEEIRCFEDEILKEIKKLKVE